ncbi:hypothetical protein IWZ03DRAFT_137909 [Phyllosticta citriasiana]|uniref:Uncharacterized protein n=1 Tax=Phyllosticta citriasiana TaxID=595635 RepID=A0ABR1KSH9_9PEZI
MVAAATAHPARPHASSIRPAFPFRRGPGVRLSSLPSPFSRSLPPPLPSSTRFIPVTKYQMYSRPSGNEIFFLFFFFFFGILPVRNASFDEARISTSTAAATATATATAVPAARRSSPRRDRESFNVFVCLLACFLACLLAVHLPVGLADPNVPCSLHYIHRACRTGRTRTWWTTLLAGIWQTP